MHVKNHVALHVQPHIPCIMLSNDISARHHFNFDADELILF